MIILSGESPSIDIAGTLGSAAGMHLPVSGSGRGIDWSELYQRDLDYRKDYSKRHPYQNIQTINGSPERINCNKCSKFI